MKIITIKLNDNQIKYLKSANNKFNFKSAVDCSGAYYLDMKYTIRIRAERLKNKEGICLLIFPTMPMAKNVLEGKGIVLIDNGTFIIDGFLFFVAPASHNPNKLNNLLYRKIKYIHCSYIESWKKEVFEKVFNVIKKSDCIVDAVISNSKINESILSFLEREDDLYTQDDLCLDNNKFICKNPSDFKYLSEKQIQTFKFIKKEEQ